MKALLENPDPKGVDPNRIGIAGAKPGRASRTAMPTGPPVDDAYCFWRYRDLLARRIIHDRVDLHRKQKHGFPQAVKFSKGQGAVALFPVAAVKKWVRENLGSADPDERLCDHRRSQPAREIEQSVATE